MEHAQQEWLVLKETPGALFVAIVVISVALFGAFTWAYQSVVAQKNAAIEGQQTTISGLNIAITRLQGEVTDLRAQLAERPALSPPKPEAVPERDPDGMYQMGGKVGTVQGAMVDRSTGIVRFSEVNGSETLNPNEPLVYRQYSLRIVSIGSSGRVAFGNQVSVRLSGVTCTIAGLAQP